MAKKWRLIFSEYQVQRRDQINGSSTEWKYHVLDAQQFPMATSRKKQQTE